MTTRSPLYRPFPGAITLASLSELFDHHRPVFGGYGMEGEGDDGKKSTEGDDGKKQDDKQDKSGPDDKKKEDKSGTGGDDGKKSEDHGYPEGTPLEQMNEKQQIAYWKHYAQTHETRNRSLLKVTGGKYGDDLKKELDELATLRRDKMSDEEKKVADAREEGKAEGLTKGNTKLARLAFEVALSHVGDERRKVLIESVDLTKVFDGDDLDTDKVKELAEALAPRSAKDKQQDADYGSGRRGSQTSTGVKAGSTRYQERHANRRGKQKTADA